MGFSAMLAEEYVLIVPFACQLHPEASGRAGRKAQQQNLNSTALTLLSSSSGRRITEYQHNLSRPTRGQKALTVSGL
jgi:hypothetical protein